MVYTGIEIKHSSWYQWSPEGSGNYKNNFVNIAALDAVIHKL